VTAPTAGVILPADVIAAIAKVTDVKCGHNHGSSRSSCRSAIYLPVLSLSLCLTACPYVCPNFYLDVPMPACSYVMTITRCPLYSRSFILILLLFPYLHPFLPESKKWPMILDTVSENVGGVYFGSECAGSRVIFRFRDDTMYIVTCRHVVYDDELSGIPIHCLSFSFGIDKRHSAENENITFVGSSTPAIGLSFSQVGTDTEVGFTPINYTRGNLLWPLDFLSPPTWRKSYPKVQKCSL
jgi:hypothetical protein